jgi:hypothetical protein
MPDSDKWTPHLDDLSAREDNDESWARRDRQAAVDWFKREIVVAREAHARANAPPYSRRKRRERQRHVEQSGIPLDIAQVDHARANAPLRSRGNHGSDNVTSKSLTSW